MTRNTVHRVEFENTTKREKERRKAVADAERDAAIPKLVRGKEPTPEERYGALLAARSPVPQSLATALGADVDPMEVAKAAYARISSGEINDPLLSRGAARAIGSALAAYQGLETAAGATGIGSPNAIKPPKVVAPGRSLGARGAAAGYVAEKKGTTVHEVLEANRSAAAKRRTREQAFPEGEKAMRERAEAYDAYEAYEKAKRAAEAAELAAIDQITQAEQAAIDSDTARAISSRRFKSGSYADLEKVLDSVAPSELVDRKHTLVAARVGPYDSRTGHPSFMVIPADNPEAAAHYLQRWARFGVANSGGTVTFVPLSSVDPAVNPRNTLFSGDAYTKNLKVLVDDLYGMGAFDRLSHRMQANAVGQRKTDGTLLTDGDVHAQIQRRASDMIAKRMKASDPISYNPNIPGIQVFDGINEITRERIYSKFGKDGAFAEAKPRRVLGREEAFTIEPDFAKEYDPDSGGFTRYMYSGDGSDSRNLTDAVIRFRQDAKGGRTARAAEGAGDTAGPETPVSGAPQNPGGPRIVINPTTFHNKKDALCVAFNEGFRVWMEANDFQPQSEPTDAQRKFLSDTAYADDELQLRRTILARIATFDTSVKDPTDDQLAETGAFLDAILESDWCKNDWERASVSKLSEAVKASVGAEPVEPRPEPIEPREPEPIQSRAALGGGETEDDKRQQEAPPQEAPPQEGEDLNGDGTVIDHQADVATQQETEIQDEVNAEYEKLRQSGALDDLSSFDNSGQIASQRQNQEPGGSVGTGGKPGENGPAAATTSSEEAGPGTPKQDAPRRGAIENDIVSKDSPGSISYNGPRRGAIENDIVSKDSPGSISYNGPRRGAIDSSMVDPTSQGSVAFSGVKDGGIESPIVDPNSPGSLSYRRRRRRKI